MFNTPLACQTVFTSVSRVDLVCINVDYDHADGDNAEHILVRAHLITLNCLWCHVTAKHANGPGYPWVSLKQGKSGGSGVRYGTV